MALQGKSISSSLHPRDSVRFTRSADVPDSIHAADSSTSGLMVPTLQPPSQSLTVGQPAPNQSASGAGTASASPTADLNSSGSTQSSSVVGPAIGGAVGGLAALLLVLTGVVLYLRRRRSKRPVVAAFPPAGMDYHDHYVHPATLTLYVRLHCVSQLVMVQQLSIGLTCHLVPDGL